jgi:hypothetical protein
MMQVIALYNMDSVPGSETADMTYHLWLLGIVSFGYFVITFLILRARCYKLSH